MNLYAYVEGNSVNYIDSTGLKRGGTIIGAISCTARVGKWYWDCGDQYNNAINDFHDKLNSCRRRGKSCVQSRTLGDPCPVDCDDFDRCKSIGISGLCVENICQSLISKQDSIKLFMSNKCVRRMNDLTKKCAEDFLPFPLPSEYK